MSASFFGGELAGLLKNSNARGGKAEKREGSFWIWSWSLVVTCLLKLGRVRNGHVVILNIILFLFSSNKIKGEGERT